ncbi:O-antigen translocase [Lysinibacillus sphaericus]|uniref:O-antigen translocase n=1 Tax=Lysinibacillus sphaericus TaxID=1421 RepID=UPI003CFF7648
MNFLKTSFWSAISTFIKLASGLMINKVIAVYIGPAGVALIGQFQNLLNVVTTLGNGAINSGVTKYVAEYNETDKHKRDSYISAAIKITLFVSILLGAVIIVGSRFISEWIFQTNQYHVLFKVLGATLWLIGLNTIILSIINGLKQIKLFIAVNITGSLLTLIITTILTVKYSLWGALLAMILVQALLLFISLPIAKKKINIQFKWHSSLPSEFYKKLLAFSLMSVVSVICVSATQIAIRNHLTTEFSLKEAGYWQSVWMISSMYLMVITTALTTYYLPRLSELEDVGKIRKEIISGYKIIIPFVLITAFAIFVLRDFIIAILFTKEFYPMRELFFYQLIGDFFKMCSWTLAFLMIAKGMTKTFIITEILFSLLFYLLTVIFIIQNGLVGVVQAHSVNYLVYFLTMLFIFRHVVFLKK